MLIAKDICTICNSQLIQSQASERDTYKVNCPRCGNYEITDEALTKFQKSELADKTLSISYWLRQHQTIDKKPIYIELKLMRSLLIPFAPPKPNEQANNLLFWIAENVNKPEGSTDLPLSYLIPVVGATNEKNVAYIAEYLREQGFINFKDFHYSAINDALASKELKAQMTFKGWERYDELLRTSKDSSLAFMAMKFGNDALERIFRDVIIPAVKETGFDIRRLDQEKRAGLIDDKLRVEIRRSKFVVADLTDENRGAYWEAGYAEGLGIQVIYICEKEKFYGLSTHFDTNHHLTVKWKDDPESLKKFSEELKATIRATFPNEAKMED